MRRIAQHPLYRQCPEAWLESQARADIETLDASLLREPVYGQMPVFAGGERGIMDLLAVDHAGRLAVVEIKASADLHLPLQALDYWIRVKWHLDRGEFTPAGYFPGLDAAPDPPRLLLVSPSLEFHPTPRRCWLLLARQSMWSASGFRPNGGGSCGSCSAFAARSGRGKPADRGGVGPGLFLTCRQVNCFGQAVEWREGLRGIYRREAGSGRRIFPYAENPQASSRRLFPLESRGSPATGRA